MTHHDPLAQALALKETLDAQDDTRTMLPLLEPLLEALRVREGLLPWIVFKDPADRPGFRQEFETGFNAFWAIYPKKVGKLKARQAAYTAARRREWPGWGAVNRSVEEQLETEQWQAGYAPHPTTFFNGGHWMNDPSTMTNGRNGRRATEDAPEYLPQSIRLRWGVMSRSERSLVLENAAMGAYR